MHNFHLCGAAFSTEASLVSFAAIITWLKRFDGRYQTSCCPLWRISADPLLPYIQSLCWSYSSTYNPQQLKHPLPECTLLLKPSCPSRIHPTTVESSVMIQTCTESLRCTSWTGRTSAQSPVELLYFLNTVLLSMSHHIYRHALHMFYTERVQCIKCRQCWHRDYWLATD